jgi:hypothetical protein
VSTIRDTLSTSSRGATDLTISGSRPLVKTYLISESRTQQIHGVAVATNCAEHTCVEDAADPASSWRMRPRHGRSSAALAQAAAPAQPLTAPAVNPEMMRR